MLIDTIITMVSATWIGALAAVVDGGLSYIDMVLLTGILFLTTRELRR